MKNYTSIHYRVCYGDTDAMGVVYYANYLRLFEIGRNELIREIFCSYQEIEQSGIMMPVVSVEAKYHRSAVFDQILEIRTSVKSLSGLKLAIETEVLDDKENVLCSGTTILTFLDRNSKRPCRVPDDFKSAIEQFMNEPNKIGFCSSNKGLT
ncbi:acyl-CoA thioesterase [Halosquirtibacter laminarini]|uniref:Acyl-CoA thioesterase n=1 Tax=Halosquirtibacter laminarini TaxID=3374600 RepID=A0AC61NIY4_9BACT|nr:acyl-CoA thioesterase [Prolixibacteraceae bacterium]